MGLQFTVSEIDDNTLPEDTFFRARLTELKERTFEWVDQKVSPPEKRSATNLEFWWEIQAPEEFRGRRVKGECKPDLGRIRGTGLPTKFIEWAEALLERSPLPPGMPIDSDDLVGLTATITVVHEADRKDPAKRWARVQDVLPKGATNEPTWDDAPPF